MTRIRNRMEMDGALPDASTYAHKCSMLMMSRQGRAAIDLIAECRDAGFTPEVKMYITCVNFLARGNRHDEVQALLQEMRDQGMTISPGWLAKVEGGMQR